MKEELIIEIQKLRYFKSELNNKYYGDFFVKTEQGDYYIFINDNKLYMLSHMINEDINGCLCEPTEAFKNEFYKKIEMMEDY